MHIIHFAWRNKEHVVRAERGNNLQPSEHCMIILYNVKQAWTTAKNHVPSSCFSIILFFLLLFLFLLLFFFLLLLFLLLLLLLCRRRHYVFIITLIWTISHYKNIKGLDSRQSLDKSSLYQNQKTCSQF